MQQQQHLPHSASLLLLVGLLYLSPLSLWSQRSATPPATRATLERALAQGRPKEAIRQAKLLSGQAQRQRDFALLLRTEAVQWEQAQQLDPTLPDRSYQRLDELEQLPWLSDRDRVALALYQLAHYEAARGARHDHAPASAPQSKHIHPQDWEAERYHTYYAQRLERLLQAPALLREPLGAYSALFPAHQSEGGYQPTFGTILLEFFGTAPRAHDSYPSAPARLAFPDLLGQALQALEQLPQQLPAKPLPPSLASAIERYSLQLRQEQSPALGSEELRQRLRTFLQHWGASPVIGHYLSWLSVTYPASGIEQARWYEQLLAQAPLLSKEKKEELRQVISSLREGRLSYTLPDHWVARDSACLTFTSAYLISSAEVRIYEVPSPARLTGSSWRPTAGQAPLRRLSLALPLDSLGILSSPRQLTLSLPHVGLYRVEVHPQGSSQARSVETPPASFITYTDLVSLVHKSATGQSLQWLDARTGSPLAGERFQQLLRESWEAPWVATGELRADSWGRIPTEPKHGYRLSSGADPLFAEHRGTHFPSHPQPIHTLAKELAQGYVTADRPAYRPGARAHFYGVYTRVGQRAEQAQVLPDRLLQAELFDASHSRIHQLTLRTDAWGRFAFDYALPTSGLTGTYHLEVSPVDSTDAPLPSRYSQRGSYEAHFGTSFEVFEYKPQESLLTLTPPQFPCHEGQRLTISGRLTSLSGSPLPEVRISYLLEAERRYWSLLRDYTQYGQGKSYSLDRASVTDASGHFAFDLSLPLLPPEEEEYMEGLRVAFPWMTYRLTVLATASSGEVLRETLLLPTSRAVARITPELPTLIDKRASTSALTFQAQGASDVRLPIRYQIKQAGRTLLEDSCLSEQSIPLPSKLLPLPTGRYELHYRSSFSDSLHYAGERAFYLFDSDQLSALPDLRSPLLLSSGRGIYSELTPPRIYWASCLPEATIFYQATSARGLLAEGILRPQGSELQALTLPLPKGIELPEAISVRLWCVRDGRLLEEKATLTRQQPQKELSLSWHTFRDRLQAGTATTYRLTLRLPDGRPAQQTAVAAWMYDSALDAFGRLQPWQPALRLADTPAGAGAGYSFGSLYDSHQGLLPERPWVTRWQQEQARGEFGGEALPPLPLLAQLRDQAVTLGDYRFHSPSTLDGIPLGIASEAVQLRSTTATHVAGERRFKASTSASASPQPPRPQLRQDFSASAFFLPRLQTDEAGEVSWSFTAPERLSRWRLLVLAHTPALEHVQSEQLIETFRPFSIRPALPRFLSEGDSLTLVTEIDNASERLQQGELSLELFDPQSQAILSRAQTPFRVAPGASERLSLPLLGFAGRDSVGVRILALGKDASDGEQHLLPVRSARQQVTERLTFTRHLAGQDSISLAHLFPHTDSLPSQGLLSIQASSHAGFFALSALSQLSSDPTSSATSLAASLYAQTLATSLRELPSLRAWAEERLKREQAPRESSHTALQQTPWASVQASEAGAEQALARQLLQPLPALAQGQLLSQLDALQQADGRWSWYPGMAGNSYTTQAVLGILLRLPESQLEEALRLRLKTLVARGIQALEQDLIQRYQRQTAKPQRLATPSELPLDILALATQAQRRGYYAPSSKGAQAQRFFLRQLQQQALRLPLAQRAEAGLILLGQGQRQLASSLATSLREHLISDQTGMFFASLVSSPYAWRDRHFTTVGETISLLSQLGQHDQAIIEGLTRWIINQKRTTSWVNELVSVEAIHALLLGQATSLASSSAPLQLSLPLRDREELTAQGSALALSLPLEQLPHPAPALQLTQHVPALVWGSATATYSLPVASLQASGKEITLAREVFLVRQQDGTEELLPLTPGQELRVGDQLRIRLSIQLDRAMDFLRLRDPRAGFAEPLLQRPSYQWSGGTGYYLEPKDSATNIYLDHLSRGTHRIEYDQRVARAGHFLGSVTELVCCYAPEFGAHTAVSAAVTTLPLE